jgi:hypothetical protein
MRLQPQKPNGLGLWVSRWLLGAGLTDAEAEWAAKGIGEEGLSRMTKGSDMRASECLR